MSSPHLVVVFRGLGGVSQAVPDAPPVIPPDTSDALVHWELNEASGATADNIGTLGAAADGTIVGTVDYGLPSLVNGVATTSLGIGPDGRVQRAHVAGLAVASATIALYFQADSLPDVGANTVLVAKDWIAEPGGISMEVYNDAGVLRARCNHRNAAGTAQWIGAATGVGTIPLHTGALLILRIINGAETSIWLRTVGQPMAKLAQIASGAGLASNDLPLRVGCYLTEPATTAIDVGFFIGLVKRFQLWGRALTDDEIAALPAPVSAVTFDGFAAGALTDNTTGSISIPGATRPPSGYVCHVDSQPANGTVISESGGTTWGYDTNAATTGADSFTGHIEAGGSSSPVASISLSVGAAPAGISLAAMTAFTPSRQQVTALAGWPAGRTPKHVSVQSGLCHGYVRRAWKPSNNDGTWMDFQPGWRKGTGKITITLDNDTLLDLNFTVNHTIPTPGSGGVVRTLDKLGGANFTSWAAAVGGCAANDVLVVRARAGGEVYSYDAQTGGATGTVNGVKVVAHPDNLAAGRRPRIHVWGTKFARYCDDLNNGHWEVFQNLGGVHGTIYRTTAVLGNSLGKNIGVSYRTKGGGIKRAYTYTDTPNTKGGMSYLTDTSYPRIRGDHQGGSGTRTAGDFGIYFWPGCHHDGDDRLYIRLSPITNQVGAKAVNAGAGVGPNPPWNWSDDDPEDSNPNNCRLYISATGNQTEYNPDPTDGINYIIRLNDRSNWTIENLDFVGGGNSIECSRSNNITVRGCRFLGWAPGNMGQDTFGQNTAKRVHFFFEMKEGFNLLVDRCEIWGGAPSNTDADENKVIYGAYGLTGKSLLLWFAGNEAGGCSARFGNCLIEGMATPTRQTGTPTYLKFHQCQLRYWGMDGALCCCSPTGSFEYVRTQIFNGSLHGVVNGNNQGTLYVGYSLILNTRPFMHKSGYWNSNSGGTVANQYMPVAPVIGHGANRYMVNLYLYNNTNVGSHNSRYSGIKKFADGDVGMVHDGGSAAFMAPHTANGTYQNFFSRNNISAAVPNGSQGSSPSAWGPGIDSHAGVVMHQQHIGWNAAGGLDAYSSNFNMYYRHSGMPTLGGSNFNGVVTTVNSGGTEQARTTIAQVQGDTGQENNGRIANPLFTGTWDATRPDHEIHRNSEWCLQAGSPARTGGDTTDRSWRDTDFGSEITYNGNAWLGCMDPLASAVEQQVGPLGPMPSEL